MVGACGSVELTCSRTPRERERYSEASYEKPGALPQTLNETWSAHEMSACRRGHGNHNERQKECRGLRIQRLDHDALSKSPLCSDGRDLLRWRIACFAEGSDAKPDQIEGADQLEPGKELRAGKDDRRYAKASRNDVHKSTQCRAEGR